jgi:hypothetical protein
MLHTRTATRGPWQSFHALLPKSCFPYQSLIIGLADKSHRHFPLSAIRLRHHVIIITIIIISMVVIIIIISMVVITIIIISMVIITIIIISMVVITIISSPHRHHHHHHHHYHLHGRHHHHHHLHSHHLCRRRRRRHFTIPSPLSSARHAPAPPSALCPLPSHRHALVGQEAQSLGPCRLRTRCRRQLRKCIRHIQWQTMLLCARL